MKIPFLNSVSVTITRVNIVYNASKHSSSGMKVGKKFIYKLPFSNTEMVPIRILNIDVAAPFSITKINYNLPAEVGSGQKMIFELRCEFSGEYAYSGPLDISIAALPVMNKSSATP